MSHRLTQEQHLGVVALRILVDVVECIATDTRLAILTAGREVPPEAYTPTPTVQRRSAEFAQRFDSRLAQETRRELQAERRKAAFQADAVAAFAAARGSWQRPSKGSSRERRPQVRSTSRRLVLSRSTADDLPPKPLAGVRGFLAANVRMLKHLERRRAAARAA